ncbi:MAG TPA: hypothetical protein P5530_03550 [Candidatus Diapherotrites archaeon]|nr:hypothetical protein [Candidatus Diapherotrites archaeon]
MNETIKRIWIFFFLMLFCNSIFAYGYSPDNYYFAEKEISSDGIIFDRGNGCMTKELSKEEVNALWGEILTKGFSADVLTSDQEENTKREKLEKNDLIVADTDAKSGDVGAKLKVPSQKIDAIEVPMIIGKTCYGSYDFGLNLNETLRVGRCNVDDNTSDCYLTKPGQYRKNDLSASNFSGFFKEVKVVGKDLIAGMKETIIKNEDADIPGKEDLGMFSDMSSYELEKIEELMQNNEINSMDTETWQSVSDKVISNTSLTSNFSVSMQTTCSGENCYINTYSLFDKMFNQYFSADMVYSSVTPFLFNAAARIFNVPGVKNAVLKPINSLKKKGVIKEGGFVDILTRDPALLVRDPFGRISKAYKAKLNYRNDVDKFIEYNLAHDEILKRNINKYDIEEFTDGMIGSVQQSRGATNNFTKEMITDSGSKLTAAQKRAATDVAQIYGDKYQAAHAFIQSKISDPITKSVADRYQSSIASGENINNFIQSLTKQEYDALEDYIYTVTKLSSTFDGMNSKYKWKEVLYNSGPINKRTANIEITDSLGNKVVKEFDLSHYRSSDGVTTSKLHVVDIVDGKEKIMDPFSKEMKLFEFEKGDFGDNGTGLKIKGAQKTAVVNNVEMVTTDGVKVTRQRLRPIVPEIDRTKVINIGHLYEIEHYMSTIPNAQIEFIEYINGKSVYHSGYLGNLDPSDLASMTISNVKIYPTMTEVFIDDVVIDKINNKTVADIYGKGYFDLDPFEVATPVLVSPPDGVSAVKKIGDTANRFNMVLDTMSHQEWVSGRGRDIINQWMKGQNGASYQRFLTRNPIVFGLNFAYWEMKSGGATFFGDTVGLTRWSMYQLPETYTALHITHKETGEIYKDAYVDFFANTGSDQGDLFMRYLNSILFWSTTVTVKIVDEIGADWSNSVVDFLKDRFQGQIRRSETDDIVLITNNISSGCNNQSCTFTLGSNYIDQKTMDASLSAMELEALEAKEKEAEENKDKETTENKKETEEKENIDTKTPETTDKEKKETEKKETTEDKETTENKEKEEATEKKDEENAEDKGLLDFIKKKESTPKLKSQVDFKSISIVTSTADGIKTNNYLLENTSEKNQKVGQTLISFSHHTDYDGTISKQSTEKAIDLVEAREKGETCGQKVTNLTLVGMPIGKVIPKSFRNHRFVTGSLVAQHFAYLVLPGSGYLNSFIGPAIVSDIPMQLMIMPEIHGCIDDEEGLYAHFFVSAQEKERQSKDSKNKVGEAIIDGTNKVEEVISKVTSGTELEKGVKAGSEKVKEYVEEQIIEDPIVQTTFTTGGITNTSVDGRLFFIEIGPKTRCVASGYSDKGVEVLKDKDTGIDVTIDKEKGILTVTDENGTRTVIGENSKDFVRLIGDNLGIPAKVIPRSLSYIPLPNNTDPLFEIDAHGNLTVKNAEFFDCLRAGYEAQTGLSMSSTSKNLTPFLGITKLTNNITPAGAYTSNFLGNSIIAQGAGLPRLIANGNTSKLTILGNRSAIVGPVDGKDNAIGKNISVQFEFGQLIYSEEAKAYIMWVETTTETSGNDIKSLKAEVTKSKAINGCDNEELGINFSTTPIKDSDQAAANTEKLNKALEKVGPFQMFDTKTKTFIFYLSDPPECEQRLKIIDKETGEIYDAKISAFEQTPNGISIKTDDGKTHNLEFSAEDGVPRLTYNGDKETLMSAQGKNGSFWYDPETGNWYTTNGNLIPLNDAFKDGVSFGVDGNGKVVGTPGTNVFNIGSGGSGKGGSGFNIPLTPESKVMAILYMTIILSGFVLIYTDRRKRK